MPIYDDLSRHWLCINDSISQDTKVIHGEFTYTDGTSETMNFIPNYFEFSFDSIQIAKKSITAKFLNYSIKANYVLSNSQLRNHLTSHHQSLAKLLKEEINSSYLFLHNNEEYRLSALDKRTSIFSEDDVNKEMVCELILIKVFKDGEKFNIKPIIKSAKQSTY